MKTLHKLAAIRAAIVSAARLPGGEKINLTKDYFELTSDELSAISKFYKLFNFNGHNNLGRSLTRQFYYHLQKGYKELQ